MNSTTQPVPPSQLPPDRSGGGCCCGMGCLSIIVIIAVALGLCVAGIWYLYAKSIDSPTDSQPVAVQMETPSEAQYAAANAKVEQVRNAGPTQPPVTVELTAADLNALIARHPAFQDFRGKARVEIADSILTVDLSVPLRDLPLPRVRNRWFNGQLRVGFAYDDDQFTLHVKSLKANGRDVDLSFLQSIADRMNEGFNEGFDKAQSENPESSEFFENVGSMKVEGDRVIITTKGPAPAAVTP